jgi:hypothetical protein
MTQKEQIAKLTETVNMLIKAVAAREEVAVETAAPQLDTLKKEITAAFTMLSRLDTYKNRDDVEIIPPVAMSKTVHALVADKVACTYAEFKSATSALVDDRKLLIDKNNRLLTEELNTARDTFKMKFNALRILSWRVRHSLPIDDLTAKYTSAHSS